MTYFENGLDFHKNAEEIIINVNLPNIDLLNDTSMWAQAKWIFVLVCIFISDPFKNIKIRKYLVLTFFMVSRKPYKLLTLV